MHVNSGKNLFKKRELLGFWCPQMACRGINWRSDIVCIGLNHWRREFLVPFWCQTGREIRAADGSNLYKLYQSAN